MTFFSFQTVHYQYLTKSILFLVLKKGAKKFWWKQLLDSNLNFSKIKLNSLEYFFNNFRTNQTVSKLFNSKQENEKFSNF